MPFSVGRGSARRAGRAHSVTSVRVLDVFAGAGGLSTGLEDAGCTIVAGAEWDRDACETFAKAHPLADVLEGDVNAMSFRDFADDVELVAGGPPCQPWSTGGKRLGEADPRDGWPAFLRILDEIRPRAVLAENVAGLAKGNRQDRFTHLLNELAERGFRVVAHVLNAADFGVPQKRQRLFIVGMRDREFEFPAPSRGPGRSKAWKTADSVVTSTALGERNPAVITYARAPDVRPSPYDGHVYNGGGRPIDLQAPAPTLLASMGGNKTPWVDTLNVVPEYHAHLLAGGHPRSGEVPGARRITVDEAALLQSFHRGTHFVGRRSSCYRQIGNAVPPDLARAVGEALVAQLQYGSAVDHHAG